MTKNNGSKNMLATCDNCGIKFNRPPRGIKRSKHHFCSQKCYWAWNRGKNNGNYGNNKLAGKNHPLYGKHRSTKTCRKISKARKGKRNSPKTEFKKGIIPWNTGMHPKEWMSPDTYKRFSTNRRRGANHPCWKGGVTDKYARLRHQKEYLGWRKAVLERDNHMCQICGCRGYIAHHIKSFFNYPKLRYNVDNGITYCRGCHTKIHWKNTIPEKINNTLKPLCIS